jgi:hypothetical protein
MISCSDGDWKGDAVPACSGGISLLLDSNEVEGQLRGQQRVIYYTSTQDQLQMIYYITQLLVYIIFFHIPVFVFCRKASALGFDEKIIRTWEYYFGYCAGMFKSHTFGLPGICLTIHAT